MAQFPRGAFPRPLADDLPDFLSASSMRAPPIRILLTILIGENRFKRATVQIHCHDIRCGKGFLRQLRA